MIVLVKKIIDTYYFCQNLTRNVLICIYLSLLVLCLLESLFQFLLFYLILLSSHTYLSCVEGEDFVLDCQIFIVLARHSAHPMQFSMIKLINIFFFIGNKGLFLNYSNHNYIWFGFSESLMKTFFADNSNKGRTCISVTNHYFYITTNTGNRSKLI